MELYFNNKKAMIRTICRTNQWSSLQEKDVNEWIYSNFPDPTGKYLATKILLHSLYYNEANLLELLKDGIYNRIIGEEIKDNLIEASNIYILKSEIESIVKEKVNKSIFVPLLDNDKPNESGNLIMRYLVQKLDINSSNSSFHYKLVGTNLDGYERLIIVDDCMGSGQQLEKFWNYNKEMRELKQQCQSAGIKIYYLSLIGYEKQLFELQAEGSLAGLRVIICDKLQECHRVFSKENNIWEDKEELDFALEYFLEIEKRIGINVYGYNDLDFAVFIHNTVPDWSLPIFWRQDSNWKPLLKRKNSVA